MASLIQVRRGPANDWVNHDPILNPGEFGFETDTGRVKIGDGSQTWNNLDYIYNSLADIRDDLLPLISLPDADTIQSSGGDSILSETAGTTVLDNVTLGPNVIGAGSGGGSSTPSEFYRLSLLSGDSELEWYTAEAADQINLQDEDNWMVGAASFQLINNNLVMVV